VIALQASCGGAQEEQRELSGECFAHHHSTQHSLPSGSVMTDEVVALGLNLGTEYG
jgi:hypothetical protein